MDLGLWRCWLEYTWRILLLELRFWDMGLACWVGAGLGVLTRRRYFSRDKYQRLRRNRSINNWIAFIVLSLYRCTPPRLMPASYGFVDPIHPDPTDGPGNDWNNNKFKLTLAAMPSLYFGTALLIGASLTVWGTNMPLRFLAPLYPAVMGFVVVATANHWGVGLYSGYVGCVYWTADKLVVVGTETARGLTFLAAEDREA